jgi:hypothetical protein
MCFSIWLLAELIVYFIVIIAVLKLSRLIGPWLEKISEIPWITQALLICIYAGIACRIVWVLFGLADCALHGAGVSHTGHFYQQ